MDNKDTNEINLDELNMVNGGLAAVQSVEMPTGRPYDLGTGIPGAEPETVPQVFAYCKLCGAQVLYLGQTRVYGCNTGEYKCTNPVCGNCNKILYNDGVDIP